MVALATTRAVPPPNDSFTNRFQLFGSSITFTATLAEATVEVLESADPCSHGSHPSVWFQWRNPPAGPTYILLEYSSTNFIHDGLTVYTTTNNAANPNVSWLAWLPANGCMRLGTRAYKPAIAINNPSPDFDHYIGVRGTSHGTFTFRMFASPSPVILESPHDLTLTAGKTIFLPVSAISSSPATYRWFHDGTLLNDETRSFLLITNASAQHAGAYHVEIVNSTGVSTSAVAIVTIANQLRRPRLSPIHQAGKLTVNIDGEPGRSYRIESSSGMNIWTNQLLLAEREPWPLWSSVTAPRSLSFSLPFTITASPKQVRLRDYSPVNEVCNANLKVIRHIKQLWARDAQRDPFAHPTPWDLQIYFRAGDVVLCPLGGRYSTNDLRLWPTCASPGHSLEEQQ